MLCSHLKMAPSSRRFPPQTRGEHLWCRSAGDASAARLFPWHARVSHTPTNPIFSCSCPWRCYGCRMEPGLQGPPGISLRLQPTASSCSPTSQEPRSECWEQRLAHRKPLCLQIQSCAVTPKNGGIWEDFTIICIVSFWTIQLQKSYICLRCSSTTLSDYQILSITSSSIW